MPHFPTPHLFACLGLLAACTATTAPSTPDNPAVESWQAGQGDFDTKGAPPAQWWLSLKDETLTRLITQAVKNNNDIGVARARTRARQREIFPKLTLSSFLGAGASSLFTSATPWSLAGNLAMPLLNFGRIESDVNAADARQQQAYHRYRKTVLEALEETENALMQFTEEKKRLASLTESAEAQREAVRLARLKFEAGDAAFIDVLIAEERLLRAESASVLSRAAVSRSVVNIYTALGIVAPEQTILQAKQEPEND